MRTFFILVSLIITYLNGLMGQIPIIRPLIMKGKGIALSKAQKVKLFKSYKFDSSSVILGVNPFADAGVIYDNYSFIIDSLNDLDGLKKSWIFKDAVSPVSDTRLFRIYYTRNKEVISTWNLFPLSSSIITNDGYYLFDTSLLSNLHLKSPLGYTIATDSVKSKAELTRLKNTFKANASYLFSIDPDTSYEGSFEVHIKAGARIRPPEEANERLLKSCTKMAAKDHFSVYNKPENEEAVNKHENAYIIRCNKRLFEKFSDPDMEKGEWIPAIYQVKSFWRK